MKDWTKVIIASSATLRETIEKIDASALQIALVLDSGQRLIGTITDGDIRRGILRGLSLDDTAENIMTVEPVVAYTNQSTDSIINKMKSRSIHQMPILTENGVLVGLELLDTLLVPPPRKNPVVLMAGGLGSRLQPLTND